MAGDVTWQFFCVTRYDRTELLCMQILLDYRSVHEKMRGVVVSLVPRGARDSLYTASTGHSLSGWTTCTACPISGSRLVMAPLLACARAVCHRWPGLPFH